MLKPTFNRVLLKRHEVKEGKILIPDNIKSKIQPMIGTVVAIGPTVDFKGLGVDDLIGRDVVFGEFSGSWITPDQEKKDDKYYIVTDEDIISILHK